VRPRPGRRCGEPARDDRRAGLAAGRGVWRRDRAPAALAHLRALVLTPGLLVLEHPGHAAALHPAARNRPSRVDAGAGGGRSSSTLALVGQCSRGRPRLFRWPGVAAVPSGGRSWSAARPPSCSSRSSYV
jgi:hypothetical protein